MRKSVRKATPARNDEIASGISALPSEPDHVKQRDHPTPSDQSDGRGNSLVGSKPRSTKRRASKINRYPARLDEGARHPKWKRPNALKSGVYSGAPLIPGEDSREFKTV
jgi:hypothetical protein